jgi:hypothetical protein
VGEERQHGPDCMRACMRSLLGAHPCQPCNVRSHPCPRAPRPSYMGWYRAPYGRQRCQGAPMASRQLRACTHTHALCVRAPTRTPHLRPPSPRTHTHMHYHMLYHISAPPPLALAAATLSTFRTSPLHPHSAALGVTREPTKSEVILDHYKSKLPYNNVNSAAAPVVPGQEQHPGDACSCDGEAQPLRPHVQPQGSGNAPHHGQGGSGHGA